jgi:hypothetical protein
VALVEAHGEALAQQLLPQFESYLDPGAAQRLGLAESRYDLVREGVVVLLGMMAGHLAPEDDKVGVCVCVGGGARGGGESAPAAQSHVQCVAESAGTATEPSQPPHA